MILKDSTKIRANNNGQENDFGLRVRLALIMLKEYKSPSESVLGTSDNDEQVHTRQDMLCYVPK